MAGLWSIAAYFNPRGYRSRLLNYRAFRDHLQTPLLTVELSFGTAFELRPEQADILLQVRGADVMWQKERLLNLALEHLPPECDSVAWLDCDVLLMDPGWPSALRRALERRALVQPFSIARDQVGPDSRSVGPPAPSYAACAGRGEPAPRAFAYSGGARPTRRLSAPGFAWAARRESIARTGFYDACILGGGDRSMIEAAEGRIDDEVAARMPSPPHASHYRAWARTFHDAMADGIGVVQGELVHLWHGDFRNRQYRVRFERFAEFDFDPRGDLAVGPEGCWRWASVKPELHAYARRLFDLREEDGPA